jgi:hypothetical protein
MGSRETFALILHLTAGADSELEKSMCGIQPKEHGCEQGSKNEDR